MSKGYPHYIHSRISIFLCVGYLRSNSFGLEKSPRTIMILMAYLTHRINTSNFNHLVHERDLPTTTLALIALTDLANREAVNVLV